MLPTNRRRLRNSTPPRRRSRSSRCSSGSMTAEKVLSEMSEIAEEILDRMKLDDLDDEEEDYVANEQKEREDDLIEKGVADGLKDHPKIAGAEIGHPEIAAIKIKGKYTPKLLAKLVRKGVAEKFNND